MSVDTTTGSSANSGPSTGLGSDPSGGPGNGASTGLASDPSREPQKGPSTRSSSGPATNTPRGGRGGMFTALRQPQLPDLPDRVLRIQHRNLDAAGRPGLVGARAFRRFRGGARYHHRLAVPADAAALPVRRPDRGPVRQATSAEGHPALAGAVRGDSRHPGNHRHRGDLACLPACAALRSRHRLRQPCSASFRAGGGRRRAPAERDRSQFRRVPRGSHCRAGTGRAGDRGRRQRLGDPRQRCDVRRLHCRPHLDRRPTAEDLAARRTSQTDRSATRSAMSAAARTWCWCSPSCSSSAPSA